MLTERVEAQTDVTLGNKPISLNPQDKTQGQVQEPPEHSADSSPHVLIISCTERQACTERVTSG